MDRQKGASTEVSYRLPIENIDAEIRPILALANFNFNTEYASLTELTGALCRALKQARDESLKLRIKQDDACEFDKNEGVINKNMREVFRNILEMASAEERPNIQEMLRKSPATGGALGADRDALMRWDPEVREGLQTIGDRVRAVLRRVPVIKKIIPETTYGWDQGLIERTEKVVGNELGGIAEVRSVRIKDPYVEMPQGNYGDWSITFHEEATGEPSGGGEEVAAAELDHKSTKRGVLEPLRPGTMKKYEKETTPPRGMRPFQVETNRAPGAVKPTEIDPKDEGTAIYSREEAQRIISRIPGGGENSRAGEALQTVVTSSSEALLQIEDPDLIKRINQALAEVLDISKKFIRNPDQLIRAEQMIEYGIETAKRQKNTQVIKALGRCRIEILTEKNRLIQEKMVAKQRRAKIGKDAQRIKIEKEFNAGMQRGAAARAAQRPFEAEEEVEIVSPRPVLRQELVSSINAFLKAHGRREKLNALAAREDAEYLLNSIIASTETRADGNGRYEGMTLAEIIQELAKYPQPKGGNK